MDKNENTRSMVWLLGILLGTYGFGIWMISKKPLLPEVGPLAKTAPLFALSLPAFVILFSIGIFLLRRYAIKNRQNLTNLIWGISFLLYSLTFLGMMLQALGLSWANTDKTGIFFIWRQSQILWVSGMLWGFALIYKEKKALVSFLSAGALVVGYVIFIFGLFMANVSNPIEYTMYLFLQLMWIPVNFILSYYFNRYARSVKMVSLNLISLGFALIGSVYFTWAPWHLAKFYYVCFALFDITLIPLLLGFVLIPYETASKENRA